MTTLTLTSQTILDRAWTLGQCVTRCEVLARPSEVYFCFVVEDLRSRVWYLGLRFQGLGFGGMGLGFRV